MSEKQTLIPKCISAKPIGQEPLRSGDPCRLKFEFDFQAGEGQKIIAKLREAFSLDTYVYISETEPLTAVAEVERVFDKELEDLLNQMGQRTDILTNGEEVERTPSSEAFFAKFGDGSADSLDP